MAHTNVKNSKTAYAPLANQKGQMALFLVLVFQVLFVFFAMSINVGLVVYDKINLQNSTDIAAYYAAQKQSEMLNQIAHINYQLRQAYKLLSFRLRVLGSVSIGVGPFSTLQRHPLFINPAIAQESVPFFVPLGDRTPRRHSPAVCVGSTLWAEYARTEGNATTSMCANLNGFSSVPRVTGGGLDPLGLVGGLNNFLDAIASQQAERCRVVGVLNWQVAASFLTAYALESQRRMEMIRSLSTKMSSPATEMTDYLGQSVYTGTRKTLEKNLTEPQRATLQLRMLNSLSSDVEGPCSDPNFWLANIDVFPVATYVRMINRALDCSYTVTSNRDPQNPLPPQEYLASVGGRNNQLLSNVWRSNAPITYGVEKNPWCMPYMKLTAQTQPRKIFSPFGGEVVLRAEAYAKPFGGRIGPWYSNQWPSGSPTSQGINLIDPLLPARSLSGQVLSSPGALDVANYSKYPGDPLGLNSTYAIGAMSNFWVNNVIRGARFEQLPPVLALAHYNHVGNPDEFNALPDSLARTNNAEVNGDPIRRMEETAIAPDLFDITYYSIEGQYSANYFNVNNENFSSSDQFDRYFLDLGSDNRQPYSVFNQINTSNQVYAAQVPFYQVENPAHLLTGWTQNRAVNYEFPELFGQCLQRTDAQAMELPSPSGCPQGGRVGYSVKLVSRKYLQSVNAELGGAGISGAILNPPPTDP